MSTLFIVLILLLLSSLVVFYASRTAISEQRVSGNEIRTKQAYAAAEAGANDALAKFAVGGVDLTAIQTSTLYVSGQRPSYYQALYCSPAAYTGSTAPSCPKAHTTNISCTAPTTTETRTPLIFACGWSDDDLAVIRILQKASGTPSTAGSITSPVVTKGATNLLVGGASIFNYFNDLTVWAGGDVPIQSNTGKTFIRDVSTDPAATSADTSTAYRTTGNSPACNNPPAHYTCSTDGNNLGPDAIINDTALSSLTSDQFFTQFMGSSPTTYRDRTATYKVDLNNTLTGEDSTSINSISGKQDAVIWVEGNASNLPTTIGSATHPVVLVVNGNLDLGSNATIYGLVFVTGAVSGNGSPTIYGAMIAGSATTSGNPKIIFDPAVLAATTRLGTGANVPGGWRDW